MTVELKWGLTIVFAGFVWASAELLFGFHGSRIESQPRLALFWIPLVMFLLVLALLDKRRSQVGALSYLEGVRSTIIIAIVVAVLSPVFQFAFYQFVDPGFFTAMVELAVSRGASLEEAQRFYTPSNYIALNTLYGVFGTLATGLVAMVILRS